MSDTEEIERPKFMNYFKTFSIFDRNKFDEILVHLTSYSLNYGLTEDDMTLVTKVSFEQNLGFMQMRKLIHCLLPRRYCTKQTVETVLEYLLFNKYELPSLLIKVLLQWFIGIIEYNLVESKNDINDFYHMFVSLMKHNNIYCVSATELVYLLTNPDDVTRGFTMDVLKLYKTRINNKHYAALLFLFKCYRPDVVPERLPVYSVHKVFGPKSSVIFKRLLYAKARIQIKNNLSPDSDNVICNKFGINMKKKFSGIQLIPAMTLPIDNAKKINNLILSSSEPNCVMSLLNNVTGAFILEFGTRITQERFSYQLYFVLYDVFLDRNCNVYYAERDRILEKVAMFQNVLKLPIPVVSKFIGQFLLTWDGYEHDQKIYNLMEWLYVKSFTELQECVLNYLMDIFMTNKVETKYYNLYST